MRRFVLPAIVLSLSLIQSSPVATQPFRPQPAILNGCSENALFAILNSDAGRECLRNFLPRYSNEPREFSVFCQGGQWGCCVKTLGFNGCKIREPIPWRRVPRAPAVINP